MRCGLLPPTRYDFYPRPPRGGRPCSCRRRVPPAGISIHALREEGDITVLIPNTYSKTFLSTPSARRATLRSAASAWYHEDFYPRPPRGGRRWALSMTPTSSRYFYPRPPRGGRRALDDFTFGKRSISIHALREEGDGCRLEEDPPHQDFYPRPPRGERPMVDVNNDLLVEISIHALREEGDGGRLLPQPPCAYFYPRPPRGGRPCGGAEGVAICHFYPRPPRGGRLDR